MKDIVFSGHQPNFLPYMGVFYKMFQSDVFVYDDDVQYSSKGLHNANFIKASGSKYRMTVPVSYEQGDLINQVKICYTKDWMSPLLKTIRMSYGKSPFFEEGYELFERHLYNRWDLLVDLNIRLLNEIVERFGLGCKVVLASKDVPLITHKNERNIGQCLALGGTVYYSGVGGAEYNDEAAYAEKGIRVVYSDYQPVRYKQAGYPFIENLSVLDYIFNQGFKLPAEWRRDYGE